MKKKNPFKEILPDKDVPPEIREKVISELEGIKLITELAELFTVKFGSVFDAFFSAKKKPK